MYKIRNRLSKSKSSLRRDRRNLSDVLIINGFLSLTSPVSGKGYKNGEVMCKNHEIRTY